MLASSSLNDESYPRGIDLLDGMDFPKYSEPLIEGKMAKDLLELG